MVMSGRGGGVIDGKESGFKIGFHVTAKHCPAH